MFLRKQLEKIYRGTLFSRHDIDGSIFYFSEEDFPGLRKTEYSFKNRKGEALQGWFFSYEGANTDRIIVFDHGLSIGHRSYFREVETLAAAGYTVYTFDHTGCTYSEGEGIGGFVTSLSDLDCCIKALKTDFADKKIAVIGHSRGGYSTLNIPAYHPDITHIVAISGFSSVKDMVNQLIPPFAKKIRAHIHSVEEAEAPEYISASAVNTLKSTAVKAMIIHSSDDSTVSVKHYNKLHSALKDMPNIRFLLVDGKVHNPHYTADAVRYKDAFFKAYKKMKKKKLLQTEKQQSEFKSSYDWHRMTAQDDKVWAEIFKHLDA